MPNTSSAKKAHRSSLNKKKFNKLKSYKIKVALKELRKEMSLNGKQVQDKLSKVFSALDKAVKTDYIPKGRADRKKSRLSAMVAKHAGAKTTTTSSVKTAEDAKTVEAKSLKNVTTKTSSKSKTASTSRDALTVNFSEDHELNHLLQKNDLQASAENRKVLVELGKELKKKEGKRVLSSEEFDSYIKNNLSKFAS